MGVLLKNMMINEDKVVYKFLEKTTIKLCFRL